jgi:undecaprenyl diphosphate synthase
MTIKDQIDNNNLPEHIAVIMDGNGRWAKTHGKPRIFGHRNGIQAVRDISEATAEIGVKFLTLYAFSTENWNRPQLEVDALMSLLISTVRNELKTLNKNSIRLNAIGDLSKLPPKTYKTLMEGIEDTKDNDRMILTLALNYSARWEITEAVKRIAEDVKHGKIEISDINDALVQGKLTTHDMPDPALMIRTSGEQRISNYLLWQLAYAELYFTDTFWPDFNKEELYKAIVDYQSRERRFGRISEQL